MHPCSSRRPTAASRAQKVAVAAPPCRRTTVRRLPALAELQTPSAGMLEERSRREGCGGSRGGGLRRHRTGAGAAPGGTPAIRRVGVAVARSRFARERRGRGSRPFGGVARGGRPAGELAASPRVMPPLAVPRGSTALCDRMGVADARLAPPPSPSGEEFRSTSNSSWTWCLEAFAKVAGLCSPAAPTTFSRVCSAERRACRTSDASVSEIRSQVHADPRAQGFPPSKISRFRPFKISVVKKPTGFESRLCAPNRSCFRHFQLQNFNFWLTSPAESSESSRLDLSMFE